LKYGHVSLGEGAPHNEPPKFLLDNFMEVASEGGFNQYTSILGHPEARRIITEIYQPRFTQELDFNKNMIITNGANSSLNVMC
jgi:aspartate/methionine/tyrosine aminotransferase